MRGCFKLGLHLCFWFTIFGQTAFAKTNCSLTRENDGRIHLTVGERKTAMLSWTQPTARTLDVMTIFIRRISVAFISKDLISAAQMMSVLSKSQPADLERSANKLTELEAAMHFTGANPAIVRGYIVDRNVMGREREWMINNFFRRHSKIQFEGDEERLALIYIGPLAAFSHKHGLRVYPLVMDEAEELLKNRQQEAGAISLEREEVVASDLSEDIISRPNFGLPILDTEIEKIVQDQRNPEIAEKVRKLLKIYQKSVPSEAEYQQMIANDLLKSETNAIVMVETKDFAPIVKDLLAVCK